MRSHLRTIVVVVLAVALLVLVLNNVDLRGVAREIMHARPEWLLLSAATMILNLLIRAWRWQYLLEPLGRPSFGNAFRATAVGAAASSVLPARAGEVIRPYFLARREHISATGAFATIILERVLDLFTVLGLLGVYLLVRPAEAAPSAAMELVTWGGGTAAVAAVVILGVLFALAGNPERLGTALARLERVLPSKLAGMLANIAEKFARGLGAIRRPGRLLAALALSVPLWLSIALGTWAVAVAFGLAISFSGSFLVLAVLVIGVAVPTPGAVGGFHAAFKFAATAFFGASDDAAVGAAIVLHAITIVPQLVLGLVYAAQEGLNLSTMKELAEQAETEPTVQTP